jgi:glycosyltransferase involved in cell wall biosynthesis
MRILHIANNDKGGAANAMHTLHDSLLLSGIDSKVLVLYKYKKSDSIYAFLQNRRLYQKLKDSISYRLFNIKRQYHKWFYGIDNNFTYFDAPYDVTKHPLFSWADIIHLHWYHNFIDLPKLLGNRSKPVVFTLHDENFFLGGYHYSFDKNAANKKSWTLDEHYYSQKQNLMRRNKNLYFVAPSKWLFDLLKQNRFGNIHQIPYGIDNNGFKNVEKKIAREKLGIGSSARVYLLLADHLSSKRKGVFETVKMFIERCDADMSLIVVGNAKEMIYHAQIVYLGYFSDSEGLSNAYSAADVFINPGLADNLPNTVLESLVCGTPVIGFNTGGMPDMINIKNGTLLDPGDFERLFDVQIFETLIKLNPIDISSSCVRDFSVEKQLLKHKKLYESLTQRG